MLRRQYLGASRVSFTRARPPDSFGAPLADHETEIAAAEVAGRMERRPPPLNPFRTAEAGETASAPISPPDTSQDKVNRANE